MKAILLMFRGGISLADAPLPGTTTASTVPGESAPTTAAPTGSTVPDQKPIGVVPPDQQC
jgi:hypothetical protein